MYTLCTFKNNVVPDYTNINAGCGCLTCGNWQMVGVSLAKKSHLIDRSLESMACRCCIHRATGSSKNRS